MTTVGALLGLGTGVGLLLFLTGWRGTAEPRPRPLMLASINRRTRVRLVVAVLAGVVAGLATRWWSGALLTTVAVAVLPTVLGPDRTHAQRVARFEAVAGWAEMLRDTLAAAAGLEQAITATAPLAPAPIRAQLTVAAAKLEAGGRLPDVLRSLATDIADPTADLVLTALILASEQRARHLGDLLGSLATAAREHAALRMRVEAGRAQARTAARITVTTTLVFAVGLVLLDRPYLTAYDPTEGQVVLLMVGGLFAAGFWWLHRLARLPEPARLITPPTGVNDHTVRLVGNEVRS